MTEQNTVTITSVTFAKVSIFKDQRPYKTSVTVTYSDDESRRIPLFSYYQDEITFTAEELIGLTSEQAHELYTQKDIAYLQS